MQVGEKIASIGQVLARASECTQAPPNWATLAASSTRPPDRVEEERVLRWVARIREALAGDGFQLHYQPVLNLQGEPLELYEAYLRLEHNGELLSPTAFLGIAEEHGCWPTSTAGWSRRRSRCWVNARVWSCHPGAGEGHAGIVR